VAEPPELLDPPELLELELLEPPGLDEPDEPELPPLQAESSTRQSATGIPFGKALRSDMCFLLPSFGKRKSAVRRGCRTWNKKLRIGVARRGGASAFHAVSAGAAPIGCDLTYL
jgi:hypothetical protein